MIPDSITSFFGEVQAQAVVTALVIQMLGWFIGWLFQRRPRITYTQTVNMNYLVPVTGPEQLQTSSALEITNHSAASDWDSHQAVAAPEPKPQVQQEPGVSQQPHLLSVKVTDYSITNRGRMAAKNVEVIFNFRPQHYERFPPLPITEQTLPDGRFMLTIGMLNPKEFVSIGLLSADGLLPNLTLVRCEGYGAKQIKSIPMRLYPMWFNVSAAVAMLFGVFSFLYFVSLFVISLL